MNKQRVMVTLTASQVRQLDAVTAETAVSRSSILSIALSEWLAVWSAKHEQAALKSPQSAPERPFVCDWCGAPATGGSYGPLGEICWCDEHAERGRELADAMPDNCDE